MAQPDSHTHSTAATLAQPDLAYLREPFNNEPGFSGADAPSEADMSRCVHCGLCLSSCPTYSTLRLETESPRGRIALMRAVHEGRVGISDRIVGHWEMCLQCRACEAVCPSGVPYGRLMEYTRAQTLAQGKQGRPLKLVDRFFLRAALPHSRRLRFGAHLLRLYQRTGIKKLVGGLGLLRLLPKPLQDMESQLPELKEPFFSPGKQVYPARPRLPEHTSDPQGCTPTVALLSGCVMPLMQGDTMRSAVRVLTRNGCHVAVPRGQVCCGALNLHAGDLATARRLARKNIDAFFGSDADQPGYKIVTASAGCGSNMKEYGELLKDDPVYAQRAVRFASLTVDITEFLAGLPLDSPRASLNRRVTYQDPCHLVHAQRISRPPRVVLAAIPGLEVVEMEASTMCCGGAGFYSMVHPDLSGQILDTKLGNIAATGAEQVVTANPGCMLQIQQGLTATPCAATGQRVAHVVDLLDEAYRAEEA